MIGADFTLADKLAVAGMLDELGVDYIEAGYRCDRRAPVEVQGDLVERKRASVIKWPKLRSGGHRLTCTL